MAWCWCNATESKPQNVSSNFTKTETKMNYIIFPIYKNSENSSELICKFKISLNLMIAIYDEEIEFNKKVCPGIPKDAPRHKEFATIQIIRNELQESLNLEIDKEYNDSKYISVFASQLIFNKKFETVFCAKCNSENSKDDVIINSWSNGYGLIAEGGRTICSNNSHELYKQMEWNS